MRTIDRTTVLRKLKPQQNYTGTFTAEQILNIAEGITVYNMMRGPVLSDPSASKAFLKVRMAGLDREIFTATWLDNRHKIIAYDELFAGTIDGASVHPREVVKAAIHHSACAVIFAHNHPSGTCEPSSADIAITNRLTEALRLIEVRVLDHFIVGGSEIVSMAQRGLI